jgi:hypothetical protein
VLWGRKIRKLVRVGLAGVGLLGALCSGAGAQVSLGDLHATGNGQLTSLYGASFGNLEGTDQHSLGFTGKGVITGDYYNPNFLSFSVLPYYGRAQDNSDMQSITDASGYNGTVNIFKGSHFPGFVTFNQVWNNSGTYGLPAGATGLATVNSNHGVEVGWSVLLPDLPTFSISYGDSGGTSSLLGSDNTTASTNRIFNVGTTYTLKGFYLTGGFIHVNSDVDINGLEDGLTETGNSSSDQYRITAQGPINYRTSSLGFGATRSTFSSDDSLVGTSEGTTDTVNGTLNLAFPKAPVTLTALYTDNLLGSIDQQLVSSGQTPLVGLNSPESRSFTVGASTFVSPLSHLLLGAFVDRTQQYFAGENYGVTQVGVSVSYNFFHKAKGLTVYAGINDSADQQGNEQLGFIGNVSYNRYVGKWEIDSYCLYNQNVQTLLAAYTISTLNFGGTVKREITPDLRWVSVASVVRSVFEQEAGNNNQGESFTTMLIGTKASLSGTYTKAVGTAIETATGLVASPLPAQALSGNAVLFNGRDYGVNLSVFPIKRMAISTAWSKALSNTTSPILLSNAGNTNYYGLLTYEYRKLLFQAGVTKFTQSISTSEAPPTMLTSYSFGISRWFKGF